MSTKRAPAGNKPRVGTWSGKQPASRPQSPQAKRKPDGQAHRGRAQTSAELTAIAGLHQVSQIYAHGGSMSDMLTKVLALAIKMTHAPMGNIQVADRQTGRLTIVAQIGFKQPFLDFWASVGEQEGTCGTAFHTAQRTIAGDVTKSPIFRGKPSLKILLQAGVRACQSTTLSARSGKLLGIFSTHYSIPHKPDKHDLRILDILARHAADIIEHRQAQAVLAASERRFGLMADTVPALIWMSGPDKRCTYFNQSWLTYTGRTLAQELGNGWTRGVHPEDFDQRFRVYVKAFDQQKPFQMEYRLRKANGTYGSILDVGVPVVLPDGTFSGYIGSCLDLTAVKLAERELALRSHQQTAIAHFSQAALAAQDLQALCNESAALLSKALQVGCSAVLELLPDHNSLLLRAGVGWQRDLIGLATLDAGPNSQADYMLRAGPAVLSEDLRAETRFTVPPLLLEHGMVSGLSMLIQGTEQPWGMLSAYTTQSRTFTAGDVHFVQSMANILSECIERGRITRRLEQRHALLESFVTHTPAAVAMLDRNLRYVAHSQRWTKDYGLVAQNLIGQHHYDVFPEIRLKSDWQEIHQRCLAGAVERREEEAFTRADGTTEWLRWEVRPWHDDTGRIGGIIMFTEVITDHKRLEEELRQAQKMEAVGRLAGGIAHDFNNFLMIILGQTDWLLKQPPLKKSLQRALEEVRTAGERAASLTNQLMVFSRKQILRPIVLSLNDAVADLEKLLRRLIGEHIALTMSLDPEAGFVEADPGQLNQVLMNLLLNARDAMPKGGAITLATSSLEIHAEDTSSPAPPGRYASLVVSDTGQGMDADTQEHIFEPFFTTKTLGHGTGLGLSMVHGIVTQTGGLISVRSQPGCGATFTVYLPQTDKVTEPAAIPPDTPAPLGVGETILLAEDEPDVLEFLRSTLEESGYRVLAARDGGDALTMAEEHPAFDLLLTDTVMPRMSGHDLAERLTAGRPSLPVIYMSGYTNDIALPHDLQTFLQKPFSVADLLKKVRTSLEPAR